MKKYHSLIGILSVFLLLAAANISLASGNLGLGHSFENEYSAALDEIYASQGYKYKIEYIQDVNYMTSDGSHWQRTLKTIVYAVDYEMNEEKQEIILKKDIWIRGSYNEEHETSVLKYGTWTETHTIKSPVYGKNEPLIRTDIISAKFIRYYLTD